MEGGEGRLCPQLPFAHYWLSELLWEKGWRRVGLPRDRWAQGTSDSQGQTGEGEPALPSGALARPQALATRWPRRPEALAPSLSHPEVPRDRAPAGRWGCSERPAPHTREVM